MRGEDFDGFPAGNIALIQRGSCNFSVKADNAAAAGAAGVIIFNQGNVVEGDDRLGLFAGTLDPPPRDIPVVSTSYAVGRSSSNTPRARDAPRPRGTIEEIDTYNLLADTAGRTDRTVVVGAHLDSVPEGPGINDNGTGTAAILETAIQMAELDITPRNRVRFAFWGGEEDGLIGSTTTSRSCPRARSRARRSTSTSTCSAPSTSVRFVYDGDGDALGTQRTQRVGPDRGRVQRLLRLPGPADRAHRLRRPQRLLRLHQAGIPAGGLFSGAEGIKTEDQAEIFGGEAGEPYDPCYHAACDDLSNVDSAFFETMADAVAHATLIFAQTTSAVNGTAKGGGGGAGLDPAFRGHQSLR